MARALPAMGIESISVNPDTVLRTRLELGKVLMPD
jgi:phosphoenolpyruvate synthase/pyruvate phosphate dikinase